MSDKEQITPSKSQTDAVKSIVKSKKRSKPEMASNGTTLFQFFPSASKRPRLSETGDGVAHAESSNLPLDANNEQHQPSADSDQKPQGKASTASSSSQNQQSPDIKKPHPILLSEDDQDKKPNVNGQPKNRKGSSSVRGTHEVDENMDDQQADQESLMDFSHQNLKKPNRDHCNKCKDGGDLLCCDNCPRSFHIKCLQVKESDIPDGEWFCKTCIPIVEKKRKHQEERKIKIEEKLKIALQRKEQKEKAQQEKEMEVERKREEKRLEKIRHAEEMTRQKEKDLEDLRRKMQNDQDRQGSNQGSQNSRDGIKASHNGISPLKSKAGNSTSVESPGRENADAAKKKKAAVIGGNQRKVPEEKTEAEKQKELRSHMMKQQMKIFSTVYPELVDKNTIKYPIDDQLIKKLPLLHGAENFPEKPPLKKVLIEGQDFEKLLYIWEFFNNFSDFLEIQNFKLEELQAALSFDQPSDNVQIYSQPNPDDEPIWENQITTKEVSENGFGLVHQLHMALVQVFLKEIKTPDYKGGQKQNEGGEINEDEDQLILTLKRYIDKPDQVWPEYLRIILTSKKAFSFQPLDQQLKVICEKLSSCTPLTYYTLLNYQEKLELLQTLIDGVHDLNDFRVFLNTRLEEKSGFNKQKIEVYAEIKNLEQQKLDLTKERAANNQSSTTQQKEEEIKTLTESLEQASRAQAKEIWRKIEDIQREITRSNKEMQKIEDQIEKKQAKIEKLNEQILQTSIKNSILGKDCDNNEYWFFKEDPNKLFVKKFETIKTPQLEDGEGNKQMVVDEESIPMQNQEIVFGWFYYESEDEFYKLLEACNQKGIRERKLQENLRRIADKMKLKKSKNKQVPKPVATGIESKEEQKEDVQMAVIEEVDEGKVDLTEDNVKIGDKHYVYETDDYYQALINAVWHGRKMPSKRQVSMEQRGRIGTRKLMGLQIQQEAQVEKTPVKEGPITLDILKKIVLDVEALFTDSSLQFQREWDFKHIRDLLVAKIVEATNVEELAQQVQRLETGFCHPHQLRYKNDKSKPQQEISDEEEMGSEVSMDENMGKEENKEGDVDKNVSVLKLRFFKFWPSEDIKSSWRNYVFEECNQNNLNALLLAIRILEKATGDFVQKQLDAQMKKLNKQKGGTKGMSTKDTKQSREAQKAATFGGRKEKTNYRQFFESSDEDDEEVTVSRGQKAKGQPGRKKKVEESDVSMSDSDESDESRDWDDKCMTCGKGGQVLCCEDCPSVCHLQCLGLKQAPSEWRCESCQYKLTRKRTTRRAEKETINNNKARGGLRYK